MAGYSKRPLAEKLGIKAGYSVVIMHPPENYYQILTPLPEQIQQTTTLNGPVEFIQFFTKEKQELVRQFPKLKKHLKEKGILWISWPKGASKVKTDLNEDVVRQIGIANGMVDIKVCAVDDVWSGLRFAFRRR